MKKLAVLIFLIFLLITGICSADTLKWNASECATGYKIYYNDHSKNVGNVTQYNINDLNPVVDIEYSISVTAYNQTGESEQSNAVTYTQTAFVPDDNPQTIIYEKPQKVTIIIE